MPRKKKIQEPAPSLFDAPEWEAKRQEIAEGLNTPYGQKFREEWAGYRTDTTVIMPPLSLVPALMAYSAQMAPIVRKKLLDAGMSPEDVDVIVRDYNGVLWAGPQMIRANPEQMEKAMNAITWPGAYVIDRWGLYSCLWEQYAICRELYAEYIQKVTGENATPKTRAEFWLSPFESNTGTAKKWLIQHYISKWEHYPAGEMASIGAFTNVAEVSGMLNAYIKLYYICKYAYNATAEELAEITIPDNFPNDKDKLRAVAEEYAQGVFKGITKSGQKLADVIAMVEKEGKAEFTSNWLVPQQDKVKFPLNMLAVLSRSIEVSAICSTEKKQHVMKWVEMFYNEKDDDGKKINERFMPQVSENRKDGREVGGITEMSIQKALEGVCLLPLYLKGSKNTVANTISYRVNMSLFADICGYNEANLSQQLALLGSLLCLNDIYIIIHRPLRYIEQEYKGKKEKKKVGGTSAAKFLTVQEIEKSGDIIITAMDGAVKGPFIVVDKNKALTMMAMAKKNLAQSRFNYQILQKSNINETDLMHQIYGYDLMIRDAQESGDKDLIRSVNRDIQRNSKRNYDTIRKWFDEYKERGIIAKYAYREKTKVYEWRVKDTAPIENDVLEPGELLPGTKEIQREIE